MLDTTFNITSLIDSLSAPLKGQLNRLGMTYCDSDIIDLIKDNLNYPLRYSPTAFSYFTYFRNHIKAIGNDKSTPSVGHRVQFTGHNGIFHKDALITSVIGNTITICEISSPPTLSLSGKEKISQKVVINTNSYDKKRFVDVSKLSFKCDIKTTYAFVLNPSLLDTELFIPVIMPCWTMT
jgi:hypothetical protein